MGFFCPKCYGKRFVTVPMRKAEDGYVCTQNQGHVFYIDKDGFPRSKKD